MLNFFIIFGLFSVFLVITGNFPGWAYLALIPLLAIQVAFAIGLGITLGVLNVFFRDVGQLFGVVLQFWFWLTPIIYSVTLLPESMHSIMAYNPMAGLMAAYQTILVKGQWPEWQSLWLVTLLACILCVLGMRLFRNHAGEMVDEL
jgi:lipopolysaccharide transport system permease protein